MTSEDHDPSRERLLQAALEIFAERGFRDATVREICAKAGVNQASVNYYFRSKDALYAEVLAFAFRQADERYPMQSRDDPDQPPAARLRRFIHNFLHRITDETRLGWHGKLITREITDPTGALDGIVEQAIKPEFAMLHGVVASLLGPGWDCDDIRRCVHSIVGQCLMYRHSRPIIQRLCPEIIAGPEEVERTAEHIARFSLAALAKLAEDRRSAS